MTCGIYGDGGTVFTDIFERSPPVQATLDTEDWIATRHDRQVRATGGVELAGAFNPKPIEDIYGAAFETVHFLMVRSAPFTR